MRRVFRWIFSLLTLLSTIALILCCCLWLRSYGTNDHVEYARDNPLTIGHLWSSRGQLAIARTHRWPTPHCEAWYEGRLSWTLRHPPTVPEGGLKEQLASARHGFRFLLDHHTATERKDASVSLSQFDQSESEFGILHLWDDQYWNRTAIMVAMPHWAVALAMSILPTLAAYRRMRCTSSRGWTWQRLSQRLLNAGVILSLFLLLVMLTGWMSRAWSDRVIGIESERSYFDPTHRDRGRISWALSFQSTRIHLSYTGPRSVGAGWRLEDRSLSVRRGSRIAAVAVVTSPYPLSPGIFPAPLFDDSGEFQFAGIDAHFLRIGTIYFATISLPYWLPLLPASIFPALWLLSWRRRRRRARRAATGLCAQCGYDLRASPERCPECGKAVTAAAPPMHDPRVDGV